MDVSRRTVVAASKVLKEADPETIEEIKAGKKTVNAALSEIKAAKLKVNPLAPSTPTPTSTPLEEWAESQPEEEGTCSETQNSARVEAVGIYTEMNQLKKRIWTFRKQFPGETGLIDAMFDNAMNMFFKPEIDRWQERRNDE